MANSISDKGWSIYVVENRCVKGITLPTDQFIAEQFEKQGFHHVVTYERLIGNKSMPRKNSPSNVKGARVGTMIKEYIIVFLKIKTIFLSQRHNNKNCLRALSAT